MSDLPSGRDLLAPASPAVIRANEPKKSIPTHPGDVAPKSLLIEGWRGLNHSYGLVNQYQILELLKIDGLRLFHHDLPFFNKQWNRISNAAGFPLDAQQQIDALQPAGDTHIDCVYRIAAPIASGADNDRRRTLTFMITELGLEPSSIAVAPDRYSFFVRDENMIVTTTAWSRDRIVEFGFPADKVLIVPLGVDTTIFQPLSVQERETNRANLGIREDEIVFVNVGGAFWNKGIDLLLRAFAELRNKGRKVRLIVKDQRGLYGATIEQIVESVAKDARHLFRSDTMAAISVIGGNLSRPQLRALYGMADCYVSPYRAEGFNLPVLESIACGTSVIVTQGGATDDFCRDGVAYRIPGQLRTRSGMLSGIPGRYIEPDFDALVDAMDSFATGHRLEHGHFQAASERILEAFSWQRAARGLAQLIIGDTSVQPPVAPVMVGVRRIRQQDVLGLLRTIRPWSMCRTPKVRIGSSYDGGYVVPATALSCDAVVSIGVGTDVSFDQQLADLGAVVLLFDNTVQRLPTTHVNFNFYKLGWGVGTEGDYLNFEDICVKLAQLGIRRSLLKFDIEGSEYEVFETVAPQMLAQFEVIVCEIHDLDRLGDSTFFDRVKRTLDSLTHHHVPVHLHGNNYAGVAMVEGVSIPRVMEVSFLRRDLDSFPAFSTERIPGLLDRPNHPYAPDICLNPFG